MILMPSNTTDFKALASKVVDEHVGTGKSLEECVVDASLDRDLTPEEIKRLVEKSNTELSLRHLRGDSKKDSFALAKFEDVIRKTHGASESESDDDENSEVEKTASGYVSRKTFTFPNTRKYAAKNISFVTAGMDKTAQYGNEINSSQYYSLRSDYERAKFEKAAAEFRIQDNLSWLVESMRKADNDSLSKFASSVSYGYRGKRPGVILRHVGEASGKGDLSKYATEQMDVIDDTTEAMKRVASVYRDMDIFRKKAEEVCQYEMVLGTSENAFRRIAGC